MYIYIYIYTYTYIYIYMYIHKSTYIYIYMITRVHTNSHVYIWFMYCNTCIYSYIHTYTHTYTHIHIYTDTHTHIYTHNLSQSLKRFTAVGREVLRYSSRSFKYVLASAYSWKFSKNIFQNICRERKKESKKYIEEEWGF